MFTDPQPDPQLEHWNYVLVDGGTNYSGVLVSGDPVGTVGGTLPGTVFVGGDYHKDFEDILVPTTNKLLARLRLEPDTSLPDPPKVGDTFILSLISADFFDSGFEAISYATSNPGAIEIVPAGSLNVIPEPGTFLILAVFMVVATPYLRRAVAERRRSK